METAKDNAARVRLMLIEYANELANETPVLCRFTECIPAPDGLGGYEERERDRAYRKGIMHPKDGLTLAACVDCLNALRDAPSVFDATRDALNQYGCELLADELTERRNRRAADIERMKGEAVRIAPAFDLPPELRVYDYDGWEAAAQTFNDGIAADVEYIQTAVAETLVAAFADYNDRLIRAGGKPILKAAAFPSLPPGVSGKGARAILEMLNNEIGIIPPARFARLTVFAIIVEFEKKISDALNYRADIRDLKTAADANANALDFLVKDRTDKINRNKKLGKDNQSHGNDEERQRAADDMKTALNRVRDRIKHGATNVLAECRKVCKDFKPLTTKKNALGKCAEYAPLTSASGEAVKPETLAKNYRARFGTKKAHKSGVKKRTK